MFDQRKETVARAMMELFNSVEHKHTLILSNGREFAMHEYIITKPNVNIYFAKLHYNWQRGINENMNGWVRRYSPKKTRFGSLSKADIQKRIKEINNAQDGF